MDLMTKVMHNIVGITLGALFFVVGEFAFTDPSILWMKNLFVFMGLFVVFFFLGESFKKFVEARDPNYGRVTYVKQAEEESKNASNSGKAKAFGVVTPVFAVMLAAFCALEADWKLLSILLLGYVVIQAASYLAVYKAFKGLWDSRREN